MIVPYNKEYNKRVDVRMVKEGYMEMYEEYIPIKEEDCMGKGSFFDPNCCRRRGIPFNPIEQWARALNNMPDNLRDAILNEVGSTGK